MNIFEAAKKFDIVSIWCKLGLDEPKKVGGGFVSYECPECGLRNKSKGHRTSINDRVGVYFCHSCGSGGDVISLVAVARDESLLEAAEWITNKSAKEFSNEQPSTNMVAKPKKVEVRKTERRKAKGLTMLAKEAGDGLDPVAVDYLKGRGLPEGLIKKLWGKKIVGTSMLSDNFLETIAELIAVDPQDPKSVNNTFKWLRNRPIVFLYRSATGVVTSAEFRRLEGGYGEKSIRTGIAEAPWTIQGNKELMIVEGVIDALSMKVLGFPQTIMAIPGAQNWRNEWLKGYKTAFIALDNDAAGHKGTLSIMLQAKYGKDNARDYLVNFKALDSWKETVNKFLTVHPNALDKDWMLAKRVVPRLNDWNDILNNQREMETCP